MIRSVCVYCGSSPGARPVFIEAAQQFGTAVAQAGLTLVYGGGKLGMMGAVADAALAAGGRVIGVIPELLLDREVGHHGLHDLHVVDDMHQRKKMMADLSDAFVTLPGGAGTLEELFEVFTWAQLNYHAKPLALLNTDSYFDPLLTMLQHTVDEGFMRSAYLDLLQVSTEPLALLERLTG
jgi:uncharacterized protein (TIGR00730 family)